jgi:hypothetical protein
VAPPAPRSGHGEAPARTAGQKSLLRELKGLAKAHPELVLAVGERARPLPGYVRVAVRLNTSHIRPVPGGLPVEEQEAIVVVAGPEFPDQPPLVLVEHDRFVGYPNVLLGDELCIYLDPSREWHPAFGAEQLLERVWKFLDDAANARFDRRTALFHAIGGRQPTNVGMPTVVVRTSPPDDARPLSLATIRKRTNARLDVVGWRQGRAKQPDHSAVVLTASTPLYRGVAPDLTTLLNQLADAGGPHPVGAADALGRAAAHSGAGQPVYLILAVHHPDAPSLQHLVPGRLPGASADQLRGTRRRMPTDPILIEWLPMSDQRSETATRRDSARPVASFGGRTVEVWGCGGVGSWTAEFIARAGAKRIVLRDKALVGGGLLVRQNFLEDDIGWLKAAQLAARLRALADELDVRAEPGDALVGIADGRLPDADILVDATVNETVAARLDEAAKQSSGPPAMAQLATDSRTATYGLLLFVPAGHPYGPATVDSWAARRVLGDGSLEAFHRFWTEPAKGDQLIPEVGCSVPTFHGSAADLASVAGSLVSLLGQSLQSGTPGVHLLAAAHAGGGPRHVFLRYEQS